MQEDQRRIYRKRCRPRAMQQTDSALISSVSRATWLCLTVAVMVLAPLPAASLSGPVRIKPLPSMKALTKDHSPCDAKSAPRLVDFASGAKNKHKGYNPTASLSKRTMSSAEMAAMTSVGAFLSLGLVVSLATNGGMFAGEEATQTFDVVTENVLDAMLPSTATDIVSITLGEAIAGVIGAASTFLLSIIVSKNNPTGPTVAEENVVADGDFFLASAAAFPIIQSLGMSPVVSSVLTSVFASVPYELVKYGSRRREQRTKEEEILQQLLTEQQARDRQSVPGVASLSLFSRGTPGSDERVELTVSELVSVDNKLDLVEIFSDLVRWLEYGILMTDFGGMVSLVPGVESAIYGVLATLSSQAYGDILYGVFGFGGVEKRDRVRSRTSSEWSAFYLSRALYAAT